MYILFVLMKKLDILRVSREHEMAGLDISEHGEIEGESYN
jgi:ammonia channel protein AmtB